MATQQAVIQKFVKSLDKTTKTGTTALNAAIKSATGSAFTSFKQVKAALINDMKNAKSADDFLKNYCGIDFSNGDTGLLVGKETGVSTTEITDADSVPESGSLKTYKKTSFTKKGLTVTLADGKTYNQLTASEKFIWNGLYTWWIENALNLIEKSYGTNFGFGSKSSATVKELSVTFVDKDDNTPASTSYSWYVDTGTTFWINLEINMHYWDSLKDDLDEANASFDRVIAHELTHAVMDANVNAKVVSSLPGFINEGLAELTVGIKNSRGDLIKELAANPSAFENNLKASKAGVSDSFVYEGGFTFFRYLARQFGDLTIENETAGTTIQSFYGNDNLANYASKVSVISGAGNDTVRNWDWSNKKVTIDAGDGNDVIENVGTYTTIKGGAGDDSVHNWNDNVKIYGGAGADTIVNDSYYDAANNVTIDGGDGNDYISNWGSSVKIYVGAGDDTVWNYGSKVTVEGGDGKDYLVGGDFADKIYGDAGADKLFGEGGKDLIYGGAGKDSLWGGAGNDTLWGDAGNDTFVYTANEGTDRIMDHESGDILKILNADGTDGSFKSSKYSGGDLTLTINGGGKIIFDDVSASDTFKINSTTYKISNNKLVKQ